VAPGQRRPHGEQDGAGTQVTTAPPIADQVHAILRGQIISGELTPNQRLTERGLSATLGVSPTPVREAISMLEYERLLVRVDGRLFVAAPDTRRLRELSMVQAALRGVAARLAAENASDAELAEIAAAYDGPSATGTEPPKSDDERLQQFRRRRQFHELIDQAAHNPTLSDMIATTTAFDFQLKSRALLRGAFPDPHPAIAEHREILDALLARDGARAETLMRDHTTTGADRYLAYAATEAGQAQPPADTR
jgi:DNA-binding GntR family transcriptional regulator